MAQTDWTEELGGGQITVTDNNPFNGARHLRFSSAETNKLMVNDQSKADSPTQGRVVCWARLALPSQGAGGATHGSGGFVFRFQDPANWYAVMPENDVGTFGNTDRFRVRLVRRLNGNLTGVDLSGIDNDWDNSNTYIKTRATFWEDAGTLFVRLEQLLGGVWTQIGGDLQDGNNELAAGGGMGLGFAGAVQNYNETSSTDYDDVELFY